MAFRRLPTKLPELVLLKPDVVADERGYLVETLRQDAMREVDVDLVTVQENHSRSRGGVLRGIHVQPGQAKLVRCARGRIWDVAVDLRPGSETFGSWEGHYLDDEEHLQLFIPAGFGHGFCALSDEVDVVYKLSAYWDPETEWGVAWDDPELGIEWPLATPVLSDKDRAAAPLSAAVRDD